MELLKRIKFGTKFIISLILLVGGILTLYIELDQINNYRNADKNLFSLTAEQLEGNTYYTCNNSYLIDNYMTDDTYAYYITPIVRDSSNTMSYMGFAVPKTGNLKMTADKLVEKTQIFINEGTIPSENISGRGFVYIMGESEAEAFASYFSESGADQERLDSLTYLTFKMVTAEQIINQAAVGTIMIGIIFIILGSVIIVSLILGKIKKRKRDKYDIRIEE